MSYILDALRRADAERERGRVPGLHTRVVPARAGLDEPAARATSHRSRRLIAAALLALGAVAALLWWWTREGQAPGDTQPTAPVSAAPAPTVPAPATAPPTAPPTAPVPAAPVAAAPAPVQPILTPQPPAPPPAAARAPAPRPATPAPAAAGGPPPGADTDLPRVADLPPPARAGLPPLQVSGATYADNPALRMLIIDGKVIQQGQDIAPGLTVESIGQRAAVLNHQGRRLRLTY
jgi:general secretion pathway protein B